MSNALYIGMLATGNIKKYQILMSTLYLLAFALCYVFFKIGLGPEYGYVSMILAVGLAVLLRLWLLQNMIPGFSAKAYITEVVIKIAPILFITFTLCYLISAYAKVNEWIEFLIVSAIAIVIVPLVSYYLALESDEKKALEKILKKIKK